MLYSLVLADDEQMMRQGLSTMVDWESLGFRVDGVFSDGGEVIEYLKENIPDVLLLDITMIHVSGIETARFVAEKNLPTKVVFLSGYRDFEYAQKAVEYNVKHYLLKPVSIPQLQKLFEEIKGQLDAQILKEEALQYRIDRYQQMIYNQRKQFFLEASLGLLGEAEHLQRQLELADITPEDVMRPLMIFTLRLAQDSAYQRQRKEIGGQEISSQIVHLLESFDQRLSLYPLSVQEEKKKLRAIYWQGPKEDYLNPGVVQKLTKKIPQAIFLMTGLTVTLEGATYFKNIEALLMHDPWELAKEQSLSVYEEELVYTLSQEKKTHARLLTGAPAPAG